MRPGLARDELRAIIGDYDALVVRSQVEVDAALIAAGRRLVVIGRAGVGVDNVDLDAATRAGITVVNAPTGNTIAAAEHTLALLFGARPAGRRGRRLDAPRRVEAEPVHRASSCAAGRSGSSASGKIGLAIAERARALEMTRPRLDPYVTAGAGRAPRRRARRRSTALLARVGRGHRPRARSPARRAASSGRESIARMKPGAFVLNVARGGIVDEAALADALRDGRLGGAGDRRLRARAADRLAAARRAEHGPDAAPRRVDRRGPGRRRRGDRRPGPRRPRRPPGALRGQRAAAHAGDGPGDRAVPAAGRDARPVLRPVRADRRRGR